MSSRVPEIRGQLVILPEMLAERVERGPHKARFFMYLAGELDLLLYKSAWMGTPPYNRPTLMAVIFYAMYSGHFEYENIVKFVDDSIGAQWILNGMCVPSYKTVERTIGAFLEELDSAFAQILTLCEQQELIGGERCYTDGVKVQANASKHKAMSYEFLGKKITRGKEDLKILFATLREIVDEWDATEEDFQDVVLEDAAIVNKGLRSMHQESLDKKQEHIFNKDFEETADQRQAQVESKIEEIKRELKILENVEPEKQDATIEALNNVAFINKRVTRMEAAKSELEDKWKAENGNKKIPDGQQINFTDSDSCIMQTKHHGVQQCYNNFAIVDYKANIIMGCYSSNNSSDQVSLMPCIERTEQTYGSLEGYTLGSDAGFFSARNISYTQNKGINFYASYPEAKSTYAKDKFKYNGDTDAYTCPEGNMLTAPDGTKDFKTRIYCNESACSICPKHGDCTKAKDGVRRIERDMEGDILREGAREKASSAEGREILRMRKSVPEPVWGNIKTQDGFIQMHYRGIEKAGFEFELHCLIQNIRKLLKVYLKSTSFQDIVHSKYGDYCKVA